MVRCRDQANGLLESMQLRWVHVTAVWELWLIVSEWKGDGTRDWHVWPRMEKKRVARTSYREGRGTLRDIASAREQTRVDGHLTVEGVRKLRLSRRDVGYGE